MILKKRFTGGVVAASFMALAACQTPGESVATTAPAQSLQQVDSARAAFVDCLLRNNANQRPCASQQSTFEAAVRTSAFRTSQTWRNHRNAWQNPTYVQNTVNVAVRDTVNLVRRGLR